MKFKVLSKFRDIVTRKMIFPGDYIEIEDQDRCQKLLSNKLAEEVREEKVTKENIIKELIGKDIDHDPKAKKEVLIALLGGE